MRRAAALAALLVGVAAWLVLGRGAVPLARLLGRGQTNLLLVSIDTLRADHVGCYGYAAAQTPTLDALAARGLRFAQATTVVPLTLPAHSSLMTGTFPAFHGVRDNGAFYLGDDQLTLAEVLRGKGYRTGGFVGAFVLDSRWGIHQGFDRYFDDFDLSKYEGMGMDSVQRRGDEVVAKALEWLGQEADRPFFAWVHLYDPHTPYEAPEPYRSRFPATQVGAYDAEIAWSDALVSRLMDRLAADGRLERTLVVVVGDHGESLGEHQEQTHGFFLYDATLQVPLIVAGPGVPARPVGDQVRIVDVMPTVLELLGVPVPERVQGRSLLALARGEHLGLVALAESWYPRYHYGWSELKAVRDGRYKLVQAPRRELYDLSADAGEREDRSGRDPARADALQKALGEMAARVGSPGAAAGPRPVDPEAEERLAALGYVSGSVSARNLEDRPRGDPKDRIGLYNLLKQAGQASVEGRIDDAIAKVREALASDGEIVEAYAILGNLHSKAKRYQDAVKAYKQALALDPEHQGATFSLALAYKQAGRLSDAETGFERARQLDTRGTKVLWQLADVFMQKGSFDRAEGVLREGLARKVDRPAFLVKLAECYVEMKRYREAESVLREALSLKRDLPRAHYDLGLAYEGLSEPGKAVEEYQAELRREPKAYLASFNLGLLHRNAGRSAEALARFRESVESNPEFGSGHLFLASALFNADDLRGAQEAARRGLGLKLEAKYAPLGHYVLADVYTRIGRPGDAAREVATARRLERGG